MPDSDYDEMPRRLGRLDHGQALDDDDNGYDPFHTPPNIQRTLRTSHRTDSDRRGHVSFEIEDKDDDTDMRNGDGLRNGADDALPTVLSLEEQQRIAHEDLFQTLAGVVGNVLEWYDFAIFGYLGDVIGEVFFPPQSGNAATVESFAVFGGAFIMRPIGGMLLGYIGDVYGRKRALVISIFLMAIPTFTMGCLPSYEQVGAVSTILLILVRLLQGLSVGGQLMSSLVFTLENHEQRRWGLYGSFVMAAANFGTLLGGIVGFVLRSSLTQEQLVAWGWRVRSLVASFIVTTCAF